MNGKRLFFCVLLAAINLYAIAYNDHRNARVDSLEAALKSSNPPKGEELLFAYDELMRGYLPYDGEKAKEYGRKALALSYQLNGLLIRQYTLRNFGLLSYGREDYDKALSYFNHALAITDTMEQSGRYTQVDLDDSRSALYGSIANAYNLQGKAHLAIHYYQRALPIFERNNWLESQVILHYNIGELYHTMGNLTEAERNYLLAIKKGKASGDSLMVGMPRKGLLSVFIEKGNYQKARETAKPCYDFYYAHRKEECEDYPVVLASMARLNLMEGHQDIKAAKAYAEEACSLADSLMFESKSDVYLACCEVAMAERQWQTALDFALRSVHPDSLATHSDVASYQMLAEIYAELGQKEKAREYIRKMYDVMTRYATDHYQSGLSQMEVLYETEKKEAQIAALDKERSLYRWLFGAAVIAFTALVAGTILLIIVQRRKKALLAAKVAIEAETKERQILARDLHDGLGGMLSLLRMKTEDGTPKEETLQLIDATTTELRRVSHHLMPEELMRVGIVSALRDFAVSVPGAEFQSFGEIKLNKEQELVLYRCAYELVNNAMKHANASHILIQLIQEPKQITLTVSDNGKGIAEGTKGMGLQNIRERIEPYHGEMQVISPEGQGTEINITQPL
jgi:signal transduction histidine kinase